MQNVSASVDLHWTAVESVFFPALQTSSFIKDFVLHALSIQFTIHKSTDVPVQLDIIKILMEYANNLSLNLSIVLPDNTSIAIQDVLLALALARHANQPLSASHVSLVDIHLTQTEYVSLHVAMA